MSTKPKDPCQHCAQEYCRGGGMTTHLKHCKKNPNSASSSSANNASSPRRATGGAGSGSSFAHKGPAASTPSVDPGQLRRIWDAFSPEPQTTAANRHHLEHLHAQVKGLAGTNNSFRPSTFVSDEMFGCPRKLKLDLAVGHGETRRRSGLAKAASDSSAAQRGDAFEESVFNELRRSSGPPSSRQRFFNMDVPADVSALTGSATPTGDDVLRAAAELCRRHNIRVYIAQATLTCNLAKVMQRDGVEALSWLTGGSALASKDLRARAAAIERGSTQMSPMKPDLLRFDPASHDPIAALTDQLGRAAIAHTEETNGNRRSPTEPAAGVTVTVIDVKSSRAGVKRSHKMQVSTYACVLQHLRRGQAWAVSGEGQVWLDPSVAPLSTAAPDSFGAAAVRFDIAAAVDDHLRPWFANVFWPKVGLVTDPLAIEARDFEPGSACGMCDFRAHCSAVACIEGRRAAFGVLGAPESLADRELAWFQKQAQTVFAAVPVAVKPNKSGSMVRTLLGQLRQSGPGALRFRVAADLHGASIVVLVADGSDAPPQFAGVDVDGAPVHLPSPGHLAAWLCDAPAQVRTVLTVDGPSQLRRVVKALTSLADSGDAFAAGALQRFFVATDGNLTTTIAALHGAKPPTAGFAVAAVDAARCAFTFPVPLAAVDAAACARYILHEIPPTWGADYATAAATTGNQPTLRLGGADVDVLTLASLVKRVVARVAAANTDDSFADAPELPALLVEQHGLVAGASTMSLRSVLSTLTEARAASEVLSSWASRGVAASTASSAAVPVVGKVVGTEEVRKQSKIGGECNHYYAWLRVPSAEDPLSTCHASVQQLTAGLEMIAEGCDYSYDDPSGFLEGGLRCLKVYPGSPHKASPCLFLERKTIDTEATQMTAYAARGDGSKELVSPVAFRRPSGGNAGAVDILLESVITVPWRSVVDGGQEAANTHDAEYFTLFPRAHRFNAGKIREALGSDSDGMWLMEILVSGARFAAGTEPELALDGSVPLAVPPEATDDQRAFISRLCTPGGGALSTALWGPPGTGKTTTLAMGITALAPLVPPSTLIVVAAVTHAAKNEVRGKLCRRLGRPFENTDSDTTDIMTLGNATVCFATAYATWKDQAKTVRRFRQAVLVVDEASQMPLDVAALLFASRVWQRVVVAGDVMQLPPIEDGQRLAPLQPQQQQPQQPLSAMRRALAQYPHAASGSIMEALLFHRQGDDGCPRARLHWEELAGLPRDQHPPELVQLTASFRSCGPIVGFLRAQLYPALTAGIPDSAFVAGGVPGSTLQPFQTMRHELGASAGGGTSAPTSLRLPELRGREARAIAAHVATLLQTHGCVNVGVVTVHRDQRREIRAAFTQLCDRAGMAADAAAAAAAAVEVDTVEKMQGQEYDAVVVAMGAVRPSFALQLRRLNVAVSRAKRHVCLSYARGVLELGRRDANATADTVAAAEFLEAFGTAAQAPVA